MNATVTPQDIPVQTCADILLKVASTREEREAAFRLTYKSYVRAGLCAENSIQLRFTPYQLLSTTDMFIAQLRGETISTMSLVRDGELGLPMEDMYGRQIAERRAAGLRLAEVSCLADQRRGRARFFGLFCDLSGLMVQLAEQLGIDQLLVAVHPRHAGIYRRYMNFKKIGSQRDYSAVQGNPAVPLCLDFNETRSNPSSNWNKFFGKQLPAAVLQPQPIRADDRAYFQDLLDSDKFAYPSEGVHLYQGAGESIHEEDTVLEEMLCA